MVGRVIKIHVIIIIKHCIVMANMAGMIIRNRCRKLVYKIESLTPVSRRGKETWRNVILIPGKVTGNSWQ